MEANSIIRYINREREMIIGVSGPSSGRLLSLKITFFNFYHFSLLFFLAFLFLFLVSSVDLLKWFIHNIFFPFYLKSQSFLFKTLLFFNI